MSTSEQYLCSSAEILSAETELSQASSISLKPMQFVPAEPLTLEFQISESDFVNAAELASMKHSRLAVAMMMVIPVAGAILMAAAVIMTTSLGSRGVANFLVATGSIFVVLPMMVRMRFRDTYRRTLDYHERQGLVVDSATLRRWSIATQETKSWQSFDSFAEDKKSFVLFQPNHPSLLPIPKRSLTAKEIAGLRAIFEANLPRK